MLTACLDAKILQDKLKLVLPTNFLIGKACKNLKYLFIFYLNIIKN